MQLTDFMKVQKNEVKNRYVFMGKYKFFGHVDTTM